MTETYKKLTDFIPFIKDNKFGEWIIDTKNDGTMEHPIQFPYVSYSRMVDCFVDEVYAFEKEHPEYGLNRYGEILEKSNIEWGTESMLSADFRQADGKTVMALLMGGVRAERFCDGALLDFLKKGAIEKWLHRLLELDQEG